MKKALREELEMATDSLAAIEAKLEGMSLEDKVDVAARLRAVAKTSDKVDKAIKGDIKAKLKDKPGTVLGGIFKATLALIPTTRFNTTAFKEADPKTYAQYEETDDQQRITFEVR